MAEQVAAGICIYESNDIIIYIYIHVYSRAIFEATMFGYNHICKLFRPYLKWMDLFLLICRNPHHVVQQIHGFSYRFLSLNQSIEIC